MYTRHDRILDRHPVDEYVIHRVFYGGAIDTESAELAVEEAVDTPSSQNASRAKIIANEAAHRVTAGLHQINGGVGFYADQTPPAFYARALALRFEMGDSQIHRLRLAAEMAYSAIGL